MKKRLIKEFKQDLTQGIKGLQISLLIIVILALVLSSPILLDQGLSKTIELISRIPQTTTDLSAILAGIIIFVAIPFTLSIKIKKLRNPKTNLR